jgi:hypothetical protein
LSGSGLSLGSYCSAAYDWLVFTLPVTFEDNSERETDRGGICVKKEKHKSLFLLFKKVSPTLVENEFTSIENPKKRRKRRSPSS